LPKSRAKVAECSFFEPVADWPFGQESGLAGYLSNLRRDVDRWRASGLIDGATADALFADAEAHSRRGFSFGTILAVLAAILVGAALLLLIAANWEAFPRLARVALIFAVIFGAYTGGALLKKRGQFALAGGLWLVAAAAFGGGIALVGQMYHLSGDETDALLVWSAGTSVAAAALRSGTLTAGAVLLAGIWMTFVAVEGVPRNDVPLTYLLYAVILWCIASWTASIIGKHLVLLSLMLFAALLYVDLDPDGLWVPMLLAAISVAVFALAVTLPELANRLTGLGNGLAVQGMFGFIAGMSIVQFEHFEGRYFLLIAILVFAGIVAALLTAGRDNRALRWLAYGCFIFELGFVYSTLLGTMLGTSGFFLAAGLTLALLAWIITRVERRMVAPDTDAGAGA
jgi:uncharacterized membrane protein